MYPRRSPQGNLNHSSSHQTPECSSSSITHPSDQLHCGQDFSSRDAADSPPIHLASDSSSKVEIHLDHIPEDKDGQEKKVTAHLFSLLVFALPSCSCASLALLHPQRGQGLLTPTELLELPGASRAALGCPVAPGLLLIKLFPVTELLHCHISIRRNVLLLLLHHTQGHPGQP